jgi:hypothetical protein
MNSSLEIRSFQSRTSAPRFEQTGYAKLVESTSLATANMRNCDISPSFYATVENPRNRLQQFDHVST